MGLDELLSYNGTLTPQEIYLYQQKIRSLNYAAVVSRPDIARATQKLAEFLVNPSLAHNAAANRVFAYLKSARGLALEYGPTWARTLFQISSDASFADNSTAEILELQARSVRNYHVFSIMMLNMMLNTSAGVDKLIGSCQRCCACHDAKR